MMVSKPKAAAREYGGGAGDIAAAICRCRGVGQSEPLSTGGVVAKQQPADLVCVEPRAAQLLLLFKHDDLMPLPAQLSCSHQPCCTSPNDSLQACQHAKQTELVGHDQAQLVQLQPSLVV